MCADPDGRQEPDGNNQQQRQPGAQASEGARRRQGAQAEAVSTETQARQVTHRFPNTNTTRKGGKHDGSHAKARAAAAQHHQWSDPCARCGHPLGPMGRWLHYDHDDINGGYLGFSHGSQPCPDCGQRCNLRAGAQLGNQRQRAARRQPAPDRQPHSYPIRVTPGGPPPTAGTP